VLLSGETRSNSRGYPCPPLTALTSLPPAVPPGRFARYGTGRVERMKGGGKREIYHLARRNQTRPSSSPFFREYSSGGKQETGEGRAISQASSFQHFPSSSLSPLQRDFFRDQGRVEGERREEGERISSSIGHSFRFFPTSRFLGVFFGRRKGRVGRREEGERGEEGPRKGEGI